MIRDAHNFNSHRWKIQFQYAGSVPTECACFCSECGCENMGDPDEFPELHYPHCTSDDCAAQPVGTAKESE